MEINSNRFSRTELLLGKEAMIKLEASTVAVFGLGGVGGHAAEALARSGIGSFVLVDNDIVSESNLNRQIIATTATIGRDKTEVMKERILSINPMARVTAVNCFYLPETAGQFAFETYSYIVDAVDTVTAKIDLAVRASQAGVPLISSMGAGNKLCPELLEIADIYETTVCPLAKVMRKELRARNISSLKVVYSKEPPLKPGVSDEYTVRRQIPGSVAFVPSVAGLLMAGEIVKQLSGIS